jgi:hypothetical protein
MAETDKERSERYKKETISFDLAAAKKRGQTYNEFFKQQREKQMKEGMLSASAYKAGRAYELYTPKEVKEAYNKDPQYFETETRKRIERERKLKEEMKQKKMASGGDVSPSKKKPEAKKAPVAPTKKMRPEDTMSEKDKAYFRRKMQEEEMMRKMGQRYDEIMPNPEFAMGGMAQKKMSKVMKEYKAGTLHSGKGGKVVKSPKQAVAIGLSEARRMKKK